MSHIAQSTGSISVSRRLGRAGMPSLLVAALVAAVAGGCAARGTRTPRPAPQPRTSPTAVRIAPTPAPAGGSPFTIAIEYGILGVAKDYAATGVTYAKPQMVYTIWGNLEPEPGVWVWGPLDALVAEYQSAGFTGLQVLLSAESSWAATRQSKLGDQGDTFPKPEYLDDYSAFVTRVVERYDADGRDDMPGLRFPIHHYGIEREFTGFWPGSAEEYVRLLRLAYPAIKAADPQAEVLLVALLVTDVFDGSPSPEEVQRRLGKTPSFRKSLADLQSILAAHGAYDIVDFHSLGDYSEIPTTTAWIRQQLAAVGAGAKRIWIGDCFPLSGLVGFGGFVAPTPFHPATLENRDAVVSLLKAVADPADPQHEPAQAWMFAEVARGLVKKIVVSAAAGIAGINVGNLEDWKTGVAAVDKLAVPTMGASMFMGLMDTTVTQERPGGKLPYSGHMFSQARKAGAPRPGFYALQLVTASMRGFNSVQRLDLGSGVWAQRFAAPAGSLWVLWYDDGKLYLPGQTPPRRTVQLPFEGSRALVTRTPTEMGKGAPTALVVQAADGALSLVLDSTPLFVLVAP